MTADHLKWRYNRQSFCSKFGKLTTDHLQDMALCNIFYWWVYILEHGTKTNRSQIQRVKDAAVRLSVHLGIAMALAHHL